MSGTGLTPGGAVTQVADSKPRLIPGYGVVQRSGAAATPEMPASITARGLPLRRRGALSGGWQTGAVQEPPVAVPDMPPLPAAVLPFLRKAYVGGWVQAPAPTSAAPASELLQGSYHFDLPRVSAFRVFSKYGAAQVAPLSSNFTPPPPSGVSSFLPLVGVGNGA